MRKISYLLTIVALVLFASCKQNFTKGKDGIEYKITADGKGDAVKAGEFLELEITSVWNNGKKDSLINTTKDQGAPQLVPFDSTSLPPAYFEIFKKLKKGDSLTTRMLTDSVFKNPMQPMPAFMKKGQYLYTNLRITNIYKNKEEADKANQVNMEKAQALAKVKAEALVKADDKTLNDYFAKNNIKATKVAIGSYVEVLHPGTGAVIDTNSIVKINYTGTLLSTGKMFDSNTDTSKHHVEPLVVNLTSNPQLGGGVIPGMAEALKTLSQGAKARLFIPSGLAYGPQARGEDLPANSNLIFTVEVLEVMSKAAAKTAMDAQQKKMMEMQKRYSDSMQKMQKPTEAAAGSK